ncbi:MAG TPA: RNA polymerase sigma factor [Solirubrobacteraceae bacterium]
MEASALPASVGLARTRIAIATPLLRLRSDEQLVSLFRAGNEDAFRAIHDRYRTRMLAYTRQMLAGSPQDPEDAVQEVFVRAYAGLRANHRELALRAWLYRIAHNRCIDELRRAHPPALEAVEALIPAIHDPVAKVEERDSLRRLIVDVQRLPEQQRSALLMRELGGMAYADVAGALGVSVPAVKSLLVRARIGLAQASEARDTACAEIREDLISSHDRGVRSSGLARRHIRDCSSCRQFRSEVRGVSRRFAALTPTLGPLGVIANLLGWGGGGSAAAGGGAVAGGGAAAAGSGAAASAGVLASGTGHVVTLLAAAIVATGGAVEIQHTLGTPSAQRAHHHRIVASPRASAASQEPSEPAPVSTPPAPTPAESNPAAPAPPAVSSASAARPAPTHQTRISTPGSGAGDARHNATQTLPISQTLDPDNMTTASYPGTTPPGAANPASPGAGTTPASGSTGISPTATTGTGSSGPGANGGTTGTPATGTTGATGTGSTTGGPSSPTAAPGTSAGPAPAGSSSGGTGTAPPAGASSSSPSATKLSTFVSQGP